MIVWSVVSSLNFNKLSFWLIFIIWHVDLSDVTTGCGRLPNFNDFFFVNFHIISDDCNCNVISSSNFQKLYFKAEAYSDEK